MHAQRSTRDNEINTFLQAGIQDKDEVHKVFEIRSSR